MGTRQQSLGPADRRQMEEMTASAPTKSAKIRVLAASGYARQQIADFLGIRYQHVRNVLVQKESYARGRADRDPRGITVAEPMSAAEVAAKVDSSGDPPRSGSFTVDAQGRVTLPPDLLAALDARPGHPLPWRFEEGELKLMGVDAAIRVARRILKPYIQRISVGGFLAERRREADSEDADGPR